MQQETMKPAIEKQPFGKTADGGAVDVYTLTNSNGIRARIMTYGAAMVSLEVPDRAGKMEDILLGYDNLDGFVKNRPYFNCIVGRYGNRIAKGKFTLDGKEYTLAVNNGENHLHGGIKGFDKYIWQAEPFKKNNEAGLKLSMLSKDGDEGYPGNLTVNVTYTLTNDNELRIDYFAATDKATVCNLTNHNYYNLTGDAKTDILGHILTLNADRFTPVDEGLIPTGKLEAVKGTPMDFTKPTAIGDRINADDRQIKFGGGYDHNWVLNKKDSGLSLAAKLYEPTSGRAMEIWTTEPGIQFYSGNFLDGTITGKEGVVYKHRWALCLETQHYPDSPNKPEFPSVVLRPGQVYKTTTLHKFYTR
jgi:aldose 1-epimerase